ncbi:MAG: family 43 glycosylhydrolase, partial [Nonomuraea sp.]|nr:family 43 glycosylhydrolase [Nonomuraea sp.]
MRRRWPAALATTLLLLLSTARPALAGAPVTTAIYTADPAALVVGDTLYLHTGHDEAPPGGTNFVMRDWHVFTSTDAATFTDQGAKLSLSNFSWAGADAWAGEVERGADGRYYWYVPVNGNGAGWMDIGVAVGDSPLGPFHDAKGGPLISDSTPNSSPLNIDPTVFTDDDGQVYMYWGSYYGL